MTLRCSKVEQPVLSDGTWGRSRKTLPEEVCLPLSNGKAMAARQHLVTAKDYSRFLHCHRLTNESIADSAIPWLTGSRCLHLKDRQTRPKN